MKHSSNSYGSDMHVKMDIKYRHFNFLWDRELPNSNCIKSPRQF